jgi:D-alanyl-D-alanine dipeptidase
MMPRCEPVSGLRIPVVECGEPLVEVCGHHALRAIGTILVRLSLVDRLVTAQTLLPARIRLLVHQGYRAADPAHAAGAAVDLGLCTVDGARSETPPDWDDLVHALRIVGLVNHPTQLRHWSYGDRYWAHKTGAAAAPFGPFTRHRPAPA